MKIHADLQLRDVPGQLIRALTPISEAGGNIVGIAHERSTVINGRIMVRVVFEIDEANLSLVLERLRMSDVDVMRFSEVRDRKRAVLLAAGVENMHGIRGVSSMRVEGDCAIITVEADSEEELESIVRGVESLCSVFLARSIE